MGLGASSNKAKNQNVSVQFVQTNVFRHLVFNVVFDRLFVQTNGRDEVAAGPEMLSGKIPLASLEISCERNRTFPLDIADHGRHGILWLYGYDHVHMVRHIPLYLSLFDSPFALQVL